MEEKPKLRRDRYKIEPTQKTRVEKATDEIVKRTLEVLCKEDVFPKRSRWLMAYKIADLINDFHNFVMIATKSRSGRTRNSLKGTNIRRWRLRS